MPPDAQFFAGLLGSGIPIGLSLAVMHVGTWITGSKHLGETAAVVVMFTLGAWYAGLFVGIVYAADKLSKEDKGEPHP